MHSRISNHVVAVVHLIRRILHRNCSCCLHIYSQGGKTEHGRLRHIVGPSGAKTAIVCIGRSNLPSHVSDCSKLTHHAREILFCTMHALRPAKACFLLARLNMVVFVRLCARSWATTCIVCRGRSNMSCTVFFSCSLDICFASCARFTQLNLDFCWQD